MKNSLEAGRRSVKLLTYFVLFLICVLMLSVGAGLSIAYFTAQLVGY